MSTPVQKLFDLKGQHALVTGGSRGLGLQIAEALGEAGAKIMLTSRKASDLEEAAAHLQAKGIDTRWVAADASDPAQVHKVCSETLRASRSSGHPGQQRRRHLGRAGRGPSARRLGQGDEPQRAQHLPVQPGHRQGEHDPAQDRAASSTSRRSPAWAATRRA